MSSYADHNYYFKAKWLDQRRTKFRHKHCAGSHHPFCNLQYEWAEEKLTDKLAASLINPSIPNVTLPKQQQRLITVNYDAITEEDLDDWIGQSMNRNISSMVNPQKQFYLPGELEDDLKQRYRNKSIVIKGEDEVYFSDSIVLTDKKGKKLKKQQPAQLIFDYRNLQVKHNPGGTPIRIRESKNKKVEIKRRHAVLLNKDLHYSRLVKQLSLNKQPTQQLKRQSATFITSPSQCPSETMFYSYNIESLKRKGFEEETPASVTEMEFLRLKEPAKDVLGKKKEHMGKKEAMHERFRVAVVDNTKQAEKKITDTLGSYTKANQNKVSSTSEIKSHLQSQKPFINTRTRFRSVKKPSGLNSTVGDPKMMGRDRVLERKIMGLLNDMQIVAEEIDVEMSEVNVHLTEVELKTIDSRPQTKWVLKAEEKLKLNQVQLAIDCYKQALIIQPQFFVPIFNIASLLQKQKQYSQSLRWFEICRQFGIDQQMVKFGLGIVRLKKMHFEQCYSLMDELIKKNQKIGVKLVYYYMRALCAKKLGRYEQARGDYGVVLRSCKPSFYAELNAIVVSALMAKQRRFELKFDCLTYMKFRDILDMVYFTHEGRLKQQNEPLKNIARKLTHSQFFKRFSISLVEKLLENSSYEYFKPDTLIFVQEDETAILLSGMVIVRNHLKQVGKPKTVSVLKQGGIIGGGKIDNGINEKSNNWFITKSEVEVIKIQRKSFYEFWKGQITFQVDFKYNFIKNVGLFRNLSESALFTICEKMQRLKFPKGTILFNDCSYRNDVVNKAGTGLGMGSKATMIDPRFLNIRRIVQPQKRKKTQYRIAELIRKNAAKFKQLKFNNLKYPGLYIVINGKIEIEDDRGFRCCDLIGEREYFGQNFLIDVKGFQKYGRMVVSSEEVEVYHVPVERMGWMFSEEDKEIMVKNTQNRQAVDTVRFLRQRFRECQYTRINYKFLVNGDSR